MEIRTVRIIVIVSIHLMLLFIELKINMPYGNVCGFNTSHVTLYLWAFDMKKLEEFCFNTSHVTLYHPIGAFRLLVYMFQYISCYSLSISVH